MSCFSGQPLSVFNKGWRHIIWCCGAVAFWCQNQTGEDTERLITRSILLSFFIYSFRLSIDSVCFRDPDLAPAGGNCGMNCCRGQPACLSSYGSRGEIGVKVSARKNSRATLIAVWPASILAERSSTFDCLLFSALLFASLLFFSRHPCGRRPRLEQLAAKKSSKSPLFATCPAWNSRRGQLATSCENARCLALEHLSAMWM